MTALVDYVVKHTVRGACRCGRCCDRVFGPDDEIPHTVSVEFFEVGLSTSGMPDADEFRRLVEEHRGEFGEVDPFDGEEHGFMELGGWIGDQGIAMQAMALGDILGVWQLRTPTRMMGHTLPEGMGMAMAQSGMVTIIAGENSDA